MRSTENKTKHQLSISVNGKISVVVDEQTYLGVTVCNNLKPGSHIKRITPKAKQCLGLIKRCFEGKTEKTIKALYDSMIRPVLEYVSSALNLIIKKVSMKFKTLKIRAPKLSS